MNRTARILLLLIITIGAITVGAWRVVRFKERGAINYVSNAASAPVNYSELWARAVERVTEDRGAMGGAAVETPSQLRHYSDRHWFLASQVAEVKKFNLPSCQDYVELAAMIERGELVTLPSVTDTYVLFGVGARADDSAFNRYQDGNNVDLFDDKSLQKLAQNFVGRSFNLADPVDRKVFKVSMLSSLRPEAVKVLEEIAKVYSSQFGRPLPVSSLIRPEQYQHVLRRVNRYAVLIETPPHTTGLAFDIDYRYMSGAEQNFLMGELARLKDAGRIEVIRERGANYHVFAFIDGQRPPDELIAASLEEAGGPMPEESPTATPDPKVIHNSRAAKKTKASTTHKQQNSKTRKRR
jgi:hypothetical protein